MDGQRIVNVRLSESQVMQLLQIISETSFKGVSVPAVMELINTLRGAVPALASAAPVPPAPPSAPEGRRAGK